MTTRGPANDTMPKPFPSLPDREMAVAEIFSQSPQHIATIIDRISAFAANYYNSISTIKFSARLLFDYINQPLEEYLNHHVSVEDDSYPNWRVAPFLARRMNESKVFESMLLRSFARPDYFDGSAYGGAEVKLVHFLYKVFQKEREITSRAHNIESDISIVRIFESVVDRLDAANARLLVGGTPRRIVRKRVGTLNLVHCLVQYELPDAMRARLVESIKKSAHSSNAYFLGEFGVQEGVRSGEIEFWESIEGLREFSRGLYIEEQRRLVDAFSDTWDKKKIVTPGYTKSYKRKEVEKKTRAAIFKAIETIPNDDSLISSQKHHDIPEHLLEASEANRLKYIDDYVIRNPGKPVSDLFKTLFPRVTGTGVGKRSGTSSEPIHKPEQSIFPTEAPVRWRDRRSVVEPSDVPGEELVSFLRAVYGSWLSDGISKQALRKLDPALINEINAWRRDGNDLPPDIQIVTRKEKNDQLLAGGADALAEHLGKFTGAEAARELARLAGAKQRRTKS